MGAWGVGILQDDTVSDVVGFVKDRIKAGESVTIATDSALSHFSELENDEDDAPLLWLALAHVQWTYGSLEDRILERIRKDLQLGNGLGRWGEDSKALAKRKEALNKFFAKIAVPKSKPSALPRLVVRKAPFKAGDCLSVLLDDGRFTAALVLKADNTNPEYGKNLIASLDYLETEPPSLAFFELRRWLIKTHGNWNNEQDISWYQTVRFKEASKRISIVGSIDVRPSDPHDSRFYSGWISLGAQITLCREHAAKFS
ncbi:hypothetical protein A1359_05170 [Methylomonas lenta]|uniref:DUF4259 domain-containing protein n=1 Tax=Methylomonas lenta TaxID=980561 RepID=A0A177NJZ8_9GAMM|nr:hypothetical protein [Methylomonas lenta]OAI18211.1 hypothetical protein A1359_05170 [Methylomonas lenta]